jgi:peroxiredoxin
MRKHLKYLLIAVLLLNCLSMVKAQNGKFIIKGKMAVQYDAPLKVYLTGNVGKTKDSCVLNKGNFEFKGQLDEPFEVTLTLQHDIATGSTTTKSRTRRDTRQFWLAPGETLINGDDQLSKATISGSKLNDDQVKYTDMFKAVYDKQQLAMDTMMTTYQTDPKAANKNYDEALRRLLPERMKVMTEFIKGHPNSYLSLVAISSTLSNNPDVSVIDPLFKMLSNEVKSTPKGKEMASIIKGLKTVGIGVKAPVFVQNDVNGKPVSLADFKGKYVLIDFWASWCIPCRAENPDVVKAHNQFKDKNFTVLGVSLDEEKTKQAWIDAIAKDQLNWTQVSDLKSWNNSAAKMYGVRAIPANFLIDPNGKIIAKNLHGDELNKKLAEILTNK